MKCVNRSYIMKLVNVLPIILLSFCLIPLAFSKVGNVNSLHNLSVSVVDNDNSPLPGVTVTSDLSDFKGVTDINGKVDLIGMKLNEVITFSFIGYETISLLFAQLRADNGKVILKSVPYDLPTIQLVGRRDDHYKYLPQQIKIIDQSSIQKTSAPNTADVLDQHGGVFVQKSQLGGGSPVIRGFEANRVLLVVDGVRMNNAIYRNGHLQNAITVDPAILEQVEVLYGPGSLMYGSDALGGVIHFRTKYPKLQFNQSATRPLIETNFYTRYASAGNAKSAHLDFNLGGHKWAYLSSLTYASFGDLRAGNNRPKSYLNFGKRPYFATISGGEDVTVKNNDPNLQVGTGYQQYDLMQKVRFQPSEKLYFDLNWQYSRSSDIPRYDQLTELTGGEQDFKFAEWYYGPQLRNLLSLKARVFAHNQFYDKGTVILAYQRIGEDRHSRRFGKSLLESTFIDLDVYSFNADFDKALGAKRLGTINYGIEVTNNNVFSKGAGIDAFTGASIEGVNARYPSGGSNQYTLGGYGNYTWRSVDTNLVFNAGLRYSFTHLSSKFRDSDPIDWPQFYLDGISGSNSALNWATGLNYHGPNRWFFKFSMGTAFRAPNIDDFAKFREKNGFVTVPNPELQTDRSFYSEMTLAISFFPEFRSKSFIRQITISATAFYTRLNNAIVRENFTLPNGDPTFISNGDTLFVQANVNADQATIYGLSGNLSVDFSENWKLKSSFNYTVGNRSLAVEDEDGQVIFDGQVPQDHIPPIYGQSSLSYQGEKFSFDAIVRYNGSKKTEDFAVSGVSYDEQSACGNLVFDRTGTADNIELGALKQPTDGCSSPFAGFYGWTTINFYADYTINQSFSINVGLENLTDLHYRPFASGVSAAGRNFILTLRGKF